MGGIGCQTKCLTHAPEGKFKLLIAGLGSHTNKYQDSGGDNHLLP